MVSREGVAGDEERAQAVRDFAPLRTKQHVQQFAGSTDWLRQNLLVEYGHALKHLTELLKPGAVFPEKGLGGGDGSPGDLAVRAIKQMAGQLIKQAVMDEAAAMDGSRPLEQIADCSGIGWGGTCLQMTRDLMGFNVLLTASKGLTPSQQAWPPLTLEGYAQLETKRAQRKHLGMMRSLCWTDHANLTRQLVLEDVDVKHLRWVSFIVSDGSQIRSLSGRSARLGDGFSRNPEGRDALVEQRTRDLEGQIGQLRGFCLESYLSDYEEGEKAFPWSIGDDAIPMPLDPAGAQSTAKVALTAGVQVELRVLVALDYMDLAAGRRKGEEWRQSLAVLMPERWVTVHVAPGPFEDDMGVPAQFAVPAGFTKAKRLLAVRRDLLTAVAELARKAAFWCADVVMGEGQGGLVVFA